MGEVQIRPGHVLNEVHHNLSDGNNTSGEERFLVLFIVENAFKYNVSGENENSSK